MFTERECEFIGCGTTANFLFEKIELAAERGYGAIVEPVGSENNRAYNIYQVTPGLGRAAPELYEACKTFQVALAIWVQAPGRAPNTLTTVFKETIGKACIKVDAEVIEPNYEQRIKNLTQGEIDALIGVYGKKVVRGWFPIHKAKIDSSTASKMIKGKRVFSK